MAKIIESTCTNCTQLEDGCCKSCIDEHKTNIFSPLTNKEIEFLIDDKKQIIYKTGETIVKQNTSSTHVVCLRSGLA